MGISIYYVITSLIIAGIIVIGFNINIMKLRKLKIKVMGGRVARCPRRGMILSCRGLSEEEIIKAIPAFLKDFESRLKSRIYKLLENEDVILNSFSFKGKKVDDGFVTSLDFNTTSTREGHKFVNKLIGRADDE